MPKRFSLSSFDVMNIFLFYNLALECLHYTVYHLQNFKRFHSVPAMAIALGNLYHENIDVEVSDVVGVLAAAHVLNYKVRGRREINDCEISPYTKLYCIFQLSKLDLSDSDIKRQHVYNLLQGLFS